METTIADAAQTRASEWDGLEDMRSRLQRYLMRRCRDENEVEDIVQETLLRAARYRDGLTSPARLGSWVTRIASNVFRDHVRRSKRLPSVGHDATLFETIEGREPGPGELHDGDSIDLGSEVIDKGLLMTDMTRAFRGLFERDQRVLRSYYVGELDSHSTANVCGIPPELVKVRLFRARQRLEQAVRLRVSERRAQRLGGVG